MKQATLLTDIEFKTVINNKIVYKMIKKNTEVIIEDFHKCNSCSHRYPKGNYTLYIDEFWQNVDFNSVKIKT